MLPAGYSFVPDLAVRCKGEVPAECIRRLSDVHVENPGGSLDIFYKAKSQYSVSKVPGIPRYGPMARTGLPHPPCPEIHPRVDRFEELLRWAEERAAENGIVPPYLAAGFSSELIVPQKRSRLGVAGSSSEAASDLDLPPLQAVDGVAAVPCMDCD